MCCELWQPGVRGDAHLSSGEGLIEGVDGDDIAQEANGVWVAAARHELHAQIHGHVDRVGQRHSIVKRCAILKDLHTQYSQQVDSLDDICSPQCVLLKGTY